MFDVHATEEEDKLVLLCALDRIGGCTEEQLLRFVVETGLQTQFRFFLVLFIAHSKTAGCKFTETAAPLLRWHMPPDLQWLCLQ